MAQYIKYSLDPSKNFNDLYEIDSSFSGTVYYNSETNLYYGYYDDSADLSNLPEWATIIDQAEFDAVPSILRTQQKEIAKNRIDKYANKIIDEKYPNLSTLLIDVNYAQNAIPGLCGDGRTSDSVITDAVAKLGDPITSNDLNTADTNIKNKTLDWSSNIPDTITDQTIINAIANYYYKVAEGIITYRKRRLILEWANNKKIEIDNMSDTDWDNMIQTSLPESDWFIDFINDCPQI